MRSFTKILIVAALAMLMQLSVQAQANGSISGTVTDSAGAVVPGASVSVRGEAGQQFSAVTADNGTFTIPAVQNGVYTVTVSGPNFKTSVVNNVKVDVGKPTAVDVVLQAGKIDETVVVTSGGEVLQTATA